ncbi:MAG: hypothetical protein HOV80_09255 [Polyangiaceae bacterium]|nr:hypothetical protein [Polyangiaceae bacterium]
MSLDESVHDENTDAAAEEIAASSPGNPTAVTLPGLPGTPTPTTLCAPDKLWFEGKCRGLNYLSRFVTPGATFIMVEGSKYEDGRNAIVVLEAPNARTARLKVIAMARSSSLMVNKKYIDSHEVVSELTVTQFLSDEGFHETVSTLDAVEGSRFKTVWYERVARGPGETYTWSSDLCVDAYGDPVGYEDGEACGPLVAQATSGDGEISAECEAVGDLVGNGLKGVCIGALAIVAVAGTVYATGQSGGTALVVAGTAAVSNPGWTLAGVLTGAAAAEVACGALGDFAAPAGKLICDAMSDAPAAEEEPGGVAIPIEENHVPFEEDPCAAMGGTSYDGDPGVVNSGECSQSESSSETHLLLGADDAEYEVTVYGDREECTPITITANDNMCVVYSY